MHRKRLLIVLLPFLSLTIIPLVGQAATVTLCTFNKDTYHQGETGYITVKIHNDEEAKIRVTELTATIDYYYTDENVYLQKFFTNATLPAQIQQGQSSIFYIPFSLPTNIASGYTSVEVKAKTELWNVHVERWLASENPTYQLTLFIETPYKEQMEEQLTVNQNTKTMMYLFGVTALLFAVVIGFLIILNRRARVVTHGWVG